MKTLTDEQKIEIENKENYEILKEKLLKEFKTHTAELEYADDDFETSLINGKKNKLAKEIKTLAAKLRDIEAIVV